MNDKLPTDAERRRLEAQRNGREDWGLWGPYLSERAWGTVREDYSAKGTAWEYFDHEQARSRAYRWSEDGMGGICDEHQRLCLALAMWNGFDPILKERAFGVTGNQGNHGEDVKEFYFYLDATPSHSYLRYLYKYPQSEYPYRELVEENQRRSRSEPSYNLLDTGKFSDNRYWDVEIRYAKAGVDEIHMRISVTNRAAARASLHVLPTLWFRNTWAWGDDTDVRPVISAEANPSTCAWAVAAQHASLGNYWLYGNQHAETLFTDNETNNECLWGVANPSPYVKDAFHRRVIHGDTAAVNPARKGTKFAAWHQMTVEAGATAVLQLVLSARRMQRPFETASAVFAARETEADAYYHDVLANTTPEDFSIARQALAGMIWNKQYYHYDVARWLDGDRIPPPPQRRLGRNRLWRHFKAADVIAMPDTWEYPWFASWDLAYQCAVLALIDVDFAKTQIDLMLKERYLHPKGQIAAYEWSFDDVNPPVFAKGALKVFRAERVQRGQGDLHFLERVMHKLLMSYTWWLNRKDKDDNNIFEGGFMGMDNISVYDRSKPLPPGYSLKQADATGGVAMLALNMTIMALELAVEDPDYEEIAIQCYAQFLSIANVIAGHAVDCPSLWDPEDAFFKDLILAPDGHCYRIDVFSFVGLIPLLATEVIDSRLLARVPRFREMLREHETGVFDSHTVCACPERENARGEHLLALVENDRLIRIMQRVLDEEQFLSPYGVRSVSKIHATKRDLGTLPGIGHAVIEYVPGESDSELFGGNSNWRGPVWMPVNYSLIQALEKFHRFFGNEFTLPAPCLNNRRITLGAAAKLIADRLVNIFRRDPDGLIPAFAPGSPFQHDPHWRDLMQFHEYFHADTGQGLGAAHQTGWTGLVVNLMLRRYRSEIPDFWRKHPGSKTPATHPAAKAQTLPT